MVLAKQNVPNFSAGVSIESHLTTLIEVARMPPSLTSTMAGESWLLERQEVSGMLITRWNKASQPLPVLALKSNCLDRCPID